MNDPVILTSVDQGVGIIELNRPSVKNALSAELTQALAAALDEFDANPDVKVLILTGAGEHFAAGADVKEMLPLSAREVLLDDFSGCCNELANFRKPVIAAVEGYALGGGCELVEMCDIVIASESARFGHPEITLGTMSGAGGTQRLSRVVGKHWAMDMLLTGKFISAQDAYVSGLVTRVVPSADLQVEAMKIAQRIARLSAPVARMIKQAVLEGLDSSLTSGLGLERKLFHLTFALQDRQEGMAAFIERRAPGFNDR